MKTSLALCSVVVALGTTVDASPLNFAALFARENAGQSDLGSDHGVQLVSQKDGTCVSPADERPFESTAVTLVDCDRAAAWQIDERSGAITLVEHPELALDAGREVSRGSQLSVYNANGSESQQFAVNEDGTVSVGRDQCLDSGNDLQLYTCDSRNDNQQFAVRSVEKRGSDDREDLEQAQGKDHDAGREQEQDKGEQREDDKGEDQYGKETKPVEAKTVTATEHATKTEHAISTLKETATEVRTKTEQAIETKVDNQTKIVTATETEQVHKTVPTTIYKTETQTKPVTETKVETQRVTETPRPVTETRVETKTEFKTETKNVTVTETPRAETKTQFITETPKPVTETKVETQRFTETQKPQTKTEYKTEYKTETKPVTRYETKYETKYERARPTQDASKDQDKEGEHH